jgi:hypothetical protein
MSDIPNRPIPALDELSRELERVRPVAIALVERRRRWVLTAAAAIALLLLVAGSLTPPGRAIANSVAHLLGIGDEPADSANRDAVIIGTGQASNFEYEVVAGHGQGGGDTCLSVEFPSIGGLVGANCLTNDTRQALAENQLTTPLVVGLPGQLYPEAELLVTGLAPPGVSQATVSYVNADGSDGEAKAELSELDRDLARHIGVDEQAQAYVAFLPPTVLPAPQESNDPLTTTVAAEALKGIAVSAQTDQGQVVDVSASSSRAASLSLSMEAPEARFADRDELGERCRLQLGPVSAAEIEVCIVDAIE